MNTPAPVDVNRLRGILGKSKHLMETVESGNYEVGNVDSSMLVQESVAANQLPPNATPRMSAPNMGAQNMGAPAMAGGNQAYTNQMVQNSKLPDSVKKMMIENPIPQPTMNHTFSLDDMNDLVEKPMPPPQSRQQYQQPMQQMPVNEQQQYQQPIQQQYQQPMQQPQMGGNDQMIRQIVQEEVMRILGNEFTKKIRESAIKSTIQTLINEGKIKTKTKPKTRRPA